MRKSIIRLSNAPNTDVTSTQNPDARREAVRDNAPSGDGVPPESATGNVLNPVPVGCVFAPYRPRIAGMAEPAYTKFLEDL
jgi:hypothetical protein